MAWQASARAETDNVESDLVLSVEVWRDFDIGVAALKLVQIGNVVLEHAVFSGMRKKDVVRIRRQWWQRLIELPKWLRQLGAIGQEHQLFVKSPIQTDDC